MNNGHATNKKYLIILLTIIIVNLAVKYTFFALINMHLHHSARFIANDTHSYLIPATYFLTTGKFLSAADQYMFVRTPGYPAFIAAVFYLFGQQPANVVIIQIALNVIPLICLYVIGSRLFSPVVGLLAAFLCMFDYLQTAHLFLIMSDSLFADLISIVIMLSVLVLTNGKKLYLKFFLLGLFLGLAVLVRPVGYFLIFPLFFSFLIYMLVRRFSAKKIVITLLLMLIPYVALVGGWQVRNKIQVGTYEYSGLSSNKGLSMLFPENYKKYIQSHPAAAKKDKLDLSDDIAMITRYPKATAKAIGIGLVRVVMGTDETLSVLILGRQYNTSQYLAAKHAIAHVNFAKLKQLEVDKTTVAMLVGYYSMMAINTLLYIFLVIGLLFVCRKSFIKQSADYIFANLLIIGVMLYFILISSNAVHDVRYRIPFQQIIDLYAALGLTALCCLFFRKR